MDPTAHMFYTGLLSRCYTLPEVLDIFRRKKITFEDCLEAKYNPSFIRALFPQGIPLDDSRCKKRNEKFSFEVRPAGSQDKESLERLAKGFCLALNGDPEKENLSDLDALVVFPEGIKIPCGALWHEGLDNDINKLYVHSLFTEPGKYRGAGAGRVLMKYLLEEVAPAGGFRTVCLDAPDNVVSFYQKLGFRIGLSRNCKGMLNLQKKVEY